MNFCSLVLFNELWLMYVRMVFDIISFCVVQLIIFYFRDELLSTHLTQLLRQQKHSWIIYFLYFSFLSNYSVPAIGVDVGGTLTKLVYFEPNDEDEPEGELEAKVLKNIRRYLTKNSAYGKTGHRDIHLQVITFDFYFCKLYQAMLNHWFFVISERTDWIFLYHTHAPLSFRVFLSFS